MSREAGVRKNYCRSGSQVSDIMRRQSVQRNKGMMSVRSEMMSDSSVLMSVRSVMMSDSQARIVTCDTMWRILLLIGGVLFASGWSQVTEPIIRRARLQGETSLARQSWAMVRLPLYAIVATVACLSR